VVLVGEALAEELGDGRYRLEDVYPGEHRLLVYAGVGDVYDASFATDVAFASAELEVLIDLCVETQMTIVKGRAKDDRGKRVAGARVGVEDLFVETTTDKKGRYELELPPGTWTVAAYGDGRAAATEVTVAGPPEPWEEVPVVELDLRLE
jgi:hypothetical protein